MKLRSRFFIAMASLSLGVAALSWIGCYIFLEPYYLSLKRQQLLDISRQIGALPSDLSNLYTRFAALERSTTVHISVVDSNGRVAYDSNSPSAAELGDKTPPEGNQPKGARPPPFVPMGELAPPESGGDIGSSPPRAARSLPPQPVEGARKAPPEPREPHPTMLDNRYLTQVAFTPEGVVFETEDPRLGVHLLFLRQKQESGSTLVLSFPIAQATENAKATLLFLTISSLIVLVVGAFLAYLIAKSATRPLGDLVSLSKSMAALDFSRRFEPTRTYEIDALGGTMNELSDSLKEALAELEESNARLRQDVEREKRVDAMRREFISSVSHELKTPISLILGYAEGILEGVAEEPKDRDDYLSIIIDETKKMDEQVRDLLELSQIDSGVLPLHIEDFDLRELVAETLSSFRRALGEHGIEPTLRLEEGRLRGDRGMLRRAIVNFLSNAISHVDEAGVIEITIERREGGVELGVFNSGPFIPGRSLDLIWNSYYKVDPSRKREFGGTGLGLAIVRGIVARHEGSYGVKNLEASGSRPAGVRFSFWIPCREEGGESAGIEPGDTGTEGTGA